MRQFESGGKGGGLIVAIAVFVVVFVVVFCGLVWLYLAIRTRPAQVAREERGYRQQHASRYDREHRKEGQPPLLAGEDTKRDSGGSDLPTSPEKGIKVSDVSEEYVFIWTAQCPCGARGKLKAQMQSLIDGPKGLMDKIDVRCTACGAEFSFYFDVSDIPDFR